MTFVFYLLFFFPYRNRLPWRRDAYFAPLDFAGPISVQLSVAYRKFSHFCTAAHHVLERASPNWVIFLSIFFYTGRLITGAGMIASRAAFALSLSAYADNHIYRCDARASYAEPLRLQITTPQHNPTQWQTSWLQQ